MFILISMKGPKGFNESSNLTGGSTVVVLITASSSLLGVMCDSAEVGLHARVKIGRYPSNTGIGVGVAVIGIDVGVLSVDL